AAEQAAAQPATIFHRQLLHLEQALEHGHRCALGQF
ncbi:MAG: hypothetical protein RLY65_2128, partial [Pseudomonadota bacterium]